MHHNPKLPAGLFHGGEIFVRDERLFCLHEKKMILYNELPHYVREMYIDLYLSDAKIQKGLKLMGITNEDDRIEQTVICNSGGFDKTPDFEKNRINREFWNCGKWSECPGFGLVCKTPAGLSRKEILIVLDVFNGLADKQTAVKNNITPNTLRTHIRRINEKIGAHCRADLVQWVKDNIDV